MRGFPAAYLGHSYKQDLEGRIMNRRMEDRITDEGQYTDEPLEDEDRAYERRRQEEIDKEIADGINKALKDIGAVTLDELIDLSRLT